jgi:mRNA-degrading endonuclease RelE of RelBE toxin-antitoxin system
VIFIESPVFTRQVIALLSDDSYAEFQRFLAKQPDAGDVIQGSGGLRKIRWAAHGKGKRGGVRVIYFHVSGRQQIRMLLAYRKGVKDDLTASEKRVLRALNEVW